MIQLPPPPVPARLREILQDYPEYLQQLQQHLSEVVAKPFGVTPLFEQAIWAIEDALDTFIDKAQDELAIAKQGGDPVAIEQAKKKDFAAGRARLNIGSMSDLRDYCNSRARS